MDYTNLEIQDQLKKKFLEKEMLVTFTKVNGEERVMRCTRNPDMIPKNKETKNKSPRVIPPSIMTVFDLDKNDWRSFRWDRVKEIKEI